MRIAAAVFAIVFTAGAAGSQDRPADRLRKAIVEEEANQNIEKAIAGYEQIVRQYDEMRGSAGAALLRLAECYRKGGRAEEAARLYARVFREFSDQTELARASRQHLANAPNLLLPAAEGNDAEVAFQHALQLQIERDSQRRHLELEVQQLQQKLAADQRRVEAGMVQANNDEALKMRARLEEMLAQLARADESLARVAEETTTLHLAPEDAKREQASLEAEYANRKAEYDTQLAEVQMLKQRIENERRKVEVGVAEANSDAMLKLQRQLADCQARIAETRKLLDRLEFSRTRR